MMKSERNKTHSAVRRDHAGNDLLTFLLAFAFTVIVTRVFLELTRSVAIVSPFLYSNNQLSC